MRDDAGEALRILLAPDRRITRHAILPTGEPEKHDALVRFTRLCQQAVNQSEVKGAFARLDEFPTQGSDDGVEAHGSQLGPQRLHVLEARGRRIVQFAAKNQEWLSIAEWCGGRAGVF